MFSFKVRIWSAMRSVENKWDIVALDNTTGVMYSSPSIYKSKEEAEEEMNFYNRMMSYMGNKGVDFLRDFEPSGTKEDFDSF